jgi:hypothetical protein
VKTKVQAKHVFPPLPLKLEQRCSQFTPGAITWHWL